MKVNREELLRNLESVQAGLSRREILEQSDCFVFGGKRVVTYNDEVSCRGPSGLDDSFRGAAKADKLLEVLREYPVEGVEVDRQPLMDLALVDAPIATIPGLIAVFFYARYKINRKSYDATQAQLQVLRRERAAKAAPAGQPGAEPDGIVAETTT